MSVLRVKGIDVPTGKRLPSMKSLKKTERLSKKDAERKRSGKKRPRPGDLPVDQPSGVASGEKTGCILKEGNVGNYQINIYFTIRFKVRMSKKGLYFRICAKIP